MAQALKVAMAANEEMHHLREGAEGREANTEGKLQVVRAHMQRWADTFIFVELESCLAKLGSSMDQVMAKVQSILVGFEPEGVTLAGEMLARMEAARERLKAFVKKTAEDSVQFAMSLMKPHIPKADLGPVGEGITPDCTDDEWTSHFDSAKPLADRIMTQIDL